MTNLKDKKVAIIVPMYRQQLSKNEKISMHQLLHFLGHYDKFIIAPKWIGINYPDFKSIKFNGNYFKSARTYSKLLLKEKFYKKFNNYEYILIYQLDALVFSDQLLDWCEKGYDYIGAPWIKEHLETYGEYEYHDACGNGGFSLRKVSSAIKIIEKAKKSLLITFYKMAIAGLSIIKTRSLKETLRRGNKIWTESAPHRTCLLEDRYWVFKAPKFNKNFKTPPIEVGLKFSFEVEPEKCFKKNNYNLPFGCHAWVRYGNKFWRQFLINKDKK